MTSQLIVDTISTSTGDKFTTIPATGLAITKTGNWLYTPSFFMCPPRNVDINGAVTLGTGKWVDGISYSEGSVTHAPRLETLSFDDLVGAATNGISISASGAITSLSFPVLVILSQDLLIGTLPLLTSFSLPAIKAVYGIFQPYALTVLTTLSAPNLVYVGSGFNPNTMAALTTFTFTALTIVGSFSPNIMAALTTLAVPALVCVRSAFNPNTMASLTTLTITNLTTVGTSFNPNTMASLTTISAPALTSVGTTINPTAMASLTTLSFAALINCGNGVTLTSGTGALTSLTLGTTSTLKLMGGNVNVTSAALTQGSVDGVLAVLANLNGTNGTTAFSSPRTVTLTGTSATPSAAGLTSKATLAARGVTVTHN